MQKDPHFSTATYPTVDPKAGIQTWVLHMLIFLVSKVNLTPRGQSLRSKALVTDGS